MTPSSLFMRGPWFAASLIAIVFSSASAETTDVINKTFDVAPGTRLVADIDCGGIEVSGTQGAQVTIEFVREVVAGSKDTEAQVLREHVVTIDQTGDTVNIHARGPRIARGGSWWQGLFGRGVQRKYQLKVSVPEKFNVELKTAGGRIRVASLTGSVEARTSGGGLEFTDITGTTKAHTSGGGIALERCKGEVDVETSGGSIRSSDGSGGLFASTSGGSITIRTHFGDVQAKTSGGSIQCSGITGNVQGHTSGGSVKAELALQPKADCSLSTSGGSITVTLPADAAVDLDASTSGGRVSCELPLADNSERKRNHLHGMINGGGPLVHLRTSGGSIRVNRGPAASVAAVGR